jgi:ABC-2 type transport system ATP-binding protein
MMNYAPSIEIFGLRVIRRGKVVIPGLSAQVTPGRITGLLGPSGCGKSTLMRAIVGVQLVEAGTVTVLGRPAGSADLRHRVGYVTQEPSVYPDLTVRENLRFFSAVLGVGLEAVGEVLQTVDLVREADDLVENLSGGQRARVSLAAALVGTPEVAILDEPTVGLDPVLRKQLWGTFRELADRGVTLIVSSHVMDEAQRCDRLLLMRDGQLIADDNPAALLARTGTDDVESAFLALVERQTEQGEAV